MSEDQRSVNWDEIENPEESDEVCGEEYVTKEGRCPNPPDNPDKMCNLHSDYNSNQARKEPSNYSHGIYADRSNYYERQDARTQAWIDAIAEEFMDGCDVEKDEHGKVELLRQVAIDFHKRRRANDYIQDRGMTQTQTEGVHERYGVIENEQENVLHITVDRLGRLNSRILKDMGYFSDDGPSEDSEEIVLNILSED